VHGLSPGERVSFNLADVRRRDRRLPHPDMAREPGRLGLAGAADRRSASAGRGAAAAPILDPGLPNAPGARARRPCPATAHRRAPPPPRPPPPQPIGRRTLPRPLRLLIALLGAAVVSVCCALALDGSFTLQGVLGKSSSDAAAPAVMAAGYPQSASRPLPALVAVSQDGAGSSIDQASFASAALAGQGSFIVYLPPGLSSTNRH